MTQEPPEDQNSGIGKMHALRSLVVSIVMNAVLPYVIYRFLEPRFPARSVVPLLASGVLPLAGVVFGIAWRRVVDVVAVLSFVEIVIGIVATLAASDVRLALLARALQGTLTGVFFLATVAAGRPLFYYIARQFVAATRRKIVVRFDMAQRLDQGRTFRRLTAVWGVAAIAVSLVNLWLAAAIAPANYVLVAPIVGIGSNVLLVLWTMRYATKRFTAYAALIRAAVDRGEIS